MNQLCWYKDETTGDVWPAAYFDSHQAAKHFVIRHDDPTFLTNYLEEWHAGPIPVLQVYDTNNTIQIVTPQHKLTRFLARPVPQPPSPALQASLKKAKAFLDVRWLEIYPSDKEEDTDTPATTKMASSLPTLATTTRDASPATALVGNRNKGQTPKPDSHTGPPLDDDNDSFLVPQDDGDDDQSLPDHTTNTHPLVSNIQPTDTFDQVWQQHERLGWYHRYDNDQTLYYIRPHCGLDGGHLGVDYYDKESFLQHLYETYGWTEPITTPQQQRRTLPQDPGQPRLEDSVSSTDSLISIHGVAWKHVWKELKRRGWTWKRPKNQLQDYLYLRPGRSVQDGRVGTDYFLSPQDVLDFLESSGQSKPEPLDSPSEVCKQLELPVDKKRKAASKAGNNNKRKKNKKKMDPHWWKTVPVSSNEIMWKVLQKVGCFQDDQGDYYVPELDRSFASLTGLRKFFCSFGVPASYTTELTEKDHESLRRWVHFANMDYRTPRQLCQLDAFKREAQILEELYKAQWSTACGKLYIPGYKQLDKWMELPKSDYTFDVAHLSTKVRDFVRRDVANALYSDRLRLWAAVTSQDLPVWDDSEESHGGRDMQKMERLESMMDPVEVEEESEEEEDVSDQTSVVSEDSEDSVTSFLDDPLWYTKTTPPDFTHTVLPILRQLGFEFRSGFYCYKRERIGTGGVDVQKFCARHGVPHFDSLDADDQTRVHRWASFAFVENVQPSVFVKKLQNRKALSENKIIELLIKVAGFQICDETYYIPNSDYIPGSRLSRQHGVHYWSSLEEALAYVRGTELEIVGRRKSKNHAEDLFALRVEAALVDHPLPTFLLEDAAEECGPKTLSSEDETANEMEVDNEENGDEIEDDDTPNESRFDSIEKSEQESVPGGNGAIKDEANNHDGAVQEEGNDSMKDRDDDERPVILGEETAQVIEEKPLLSADVLEAKKESTNEDAPPPLDESSCSPHATGPKENNENSTETTTENSASNELKNSKGSPTTLEQDATFSVEEKQKGQDDPPSLAPNREPSDEHCLDASFSTQPDHEFDENSTNMAGDENDDLLPLTQFQDDKNEPTKEEAQDNADGEAMNVDNEEDKWNGQEDTKSAHSNPKVVDLGEIEVHKPYGEEKPESDEEEDLSSTASPVITTKRAPRVNFGPLSASGGASTEHNAPALDRVLQAPRRRLSPCRSVLENLPPPKDEQDDQIVAVHSRDSSDDEEGSEDESSRKGVERLLQDDSDDESCYKFHHDIPLTQPLGGKANDYGGN